MGIYMCSAILASDCIAQFIVHILDASASYGLVRT